MPRTWAGAEVVMRTALEELIEEDTYDLTEPTHALVFVECDGYVTATHGLRDRRRTPPPCGYPQNPLGRRSSPRRHARKERTDSRR